MTCPLPPPIRDALDHLLDIADRDTGSGRRVADFLLSWWNADTCGGWNPVDLWGLDPALRVDILRVIIYLALPGACNPDTLGYKAVFERLVHERRPHLAGGSLQ